MLAKYIRIDGVNGGTGHGVFLLGRSLVGMTFRARCRAYEAISCAIPFSGPPAGRLNPGRGGHRHADGSRSLS
jgi:hypothetical protein